MYDISTLLDYDINFCNNNLNNANDLLNIIKIQLSLIDCDSKINDNTIDINYLSS